MKPQTLLATVLLVAPLAATAGVNLKNGNFFITYQDIALQSGGHELSLSRTYNSRAPETGWFGAGWGSRFETRLVVMPDGSAAVKENGSGQVNYYRPDGKADIQRGVLRILERATRQDDLAESAVMALRDKLERDEDLRVRKVIQYGVQADLPTNALLRSNLCAAATLTRVAAGYKRSACDRSTDYFDPQGRLLRHEEGDGYSVSAAYEGARPNLISDTLGQRLELKWTDDGLLASATGDSQHRVSYTYNEKKDLIKSDDPNGNQYNYEYDGNHNLTRIGYIDNSSMRIEFLTSADGAVKSVTERSGEQRLYEYRSDPADSGHTWTRVTAIDDSGQKESREHEFRTRTSDTGAEMLASTASSAGRNRVETIYDDRGRVSRKRNADGEIAAYTYDPVSGKLQTVVENGVKTSFRYDRKGELTRAENSKGQVITLDYGKTALIQSMTATNRIEHTRDTLHFKYNAAGKPVEIKLIGKGKIDVEYDDQGEITKVASAQGAKMALQVTQIFQDLLSVVKAGGARL